ncbi:MAG: hypothetical protein ACREFR_05950 [Limisphaerales bacterium]
MYIYEMTVSMAQIRIAATAAFIMLGASSRAMAQLSTNDAANIFTHFYNAFFVSSSGGGEYIWQQRGSFSKDDQWENAEMIEMTIDRYIAAPDTADSNAMTGLLNGFDKAYGSDWTSDIYNDDIMWCVLAHARAYLALYNATAAINSSMRSWAAIASNNFCWVYDGGHPPGRILPQYDDTFGAGCGGPPITSAAATRRTSLKIPVLTARRPWRRFISI